VSAPATTNTPTVPTFEQHGLKAHSDGDWDHKIPVQTRSERFKSTDVADFPDVTGREVDWRYSPVAKLADLISGELDGSAYAYSATDAAGVHVTWVDRDDARIGRAGTPEDKASANAWTAFEKALLVSISGEEAKTVHLRRDSLGSTPRGAHTIIDAAPFSRALLVLENHGEAKLTENLEILLGEGAQVTVVSVQEWADDAVHLANHFARVSRDAKLKHIVVSLGGAIVRVNPAILLAVQGADFEAFGM
jgi:Fe-S cluster assembly protein SufD